MEKCPFCGSEDIYFSKKRKIFVCEDCDETFSEQQMTEAAAPVSVGGGLELFFSYGHDRNRLLVERIKRDLEKRGHHVWIDTSEIKAGDHWRDDILSGVLKASSVIAFLSEHSTRNPGVCLDELRIAVCVKGAQVRTVLLEPESRIKPPATISDIQWLDMSSWAEMKKTSDAAFEQWYKEKFAELCRVIESSESAELSGDIHVLKTRLSPYLNSEKEYNLLSKEFYGRRWLEEHIEDWQDNRSSKVLIVYGRPGSGKSAFSVNYSHYNSDVYGCFLCEWNREYTIDPRRLIRTMAFRLAAKLPDYRSMLLHQLEEDVSLDTMNAEALFDFLLSYPLSNLVDGNRETGIIVVDGLDEAETNGENPLADVFARCCERLPGWIKFLFTSRPERSVSRYFKACESIDIIEDMPAGYNDIMAYLVRALAAELSQTSNKLETLNRICELSDGVFLYAELLVADIKSGVIGLKDIDTFPRGLGAFYRLSMERKFPSPEEFLKVRGLLEMLSVSDTIPEDLARSVTGQTRYSFITSLDRLGSWVSRFEEDGIALLGFSHKSVRDWFTDREQSGSFYVDHKAGALHLARYAREYIENGGRTGSRSGSGNDSRNGDGSCLNPALEGYVRGHVGGYYISCEQFAELEDFLCAHKEEPDPYWRVWNRFPEDWDQAKLLDAFWTSGQRSAFLRRLQREGSVDFPLWILQLAEKEYGITEFDRELVSIYMDMVHMSGQYARAVDIADQYLKGNAGQVADSEFLSMLSVRRLHHSMFFKPAGQLLDEAMALYSRIDDRFPAVYNELLFLIGGNLGVLYGDWDFCRKWLERSESFAKAHGLEDYRKRNARKLADCCCAAGDYEGAEKILKEYIGEDGRITGRYEAYLVGALANVYTCTGNDDEALHCFRELMKFTTAQGIIGWTAHADLGIANIYFKLGNLKEAVDYAKRAKAIYAGANHEWGLIMTEALLAACESRMGIAPLRVACESAIKHAERMQYGSSAESIRELSEGKKNYLKLWFL